MPSSRPGGPRVVSAGGASSGIPPRPAADDGWGPATAVRPTRQPPQQIRPAPVGNGWSGPARPARSRPPESPAQRLARIGRQPSTERGLPPWAALLLLTAIAGVGGLIDTISGAQIRGGFNIGIIVASVVAILAVRRSGMFPVIIAPPLVYAGASGAMLYLRSGGLQDRHVLFDAAANWLVYGFPAIAAATAAVLVIAGVRLLTRR